MKEKIKGTKLIILSLLVQRPPEAYSLTSNDLSAPLAVGTGAVLSHFQPYTHSQYSFQLSSDNQGHMKPIYHPCLRLFLPKDLFQHHNLIRVIKTRYVSLYFSIDR